MKIICIGLNYKSHIQELKCETPEQPLFFLKPETSMILRNRPFFLPDFSNDIHYEVELLVKINKVGKFIQKRFAHTYYDEIGLAKLLMVLPLSETSFQNLNLLIYRI